MTELIPTNQWVYDLFKVTFSHGTFKTTAYFASSCENHLVSDINEYAPSWCTEYAWECVKENVGHPRVIGSMHGVPLHESSSSHGQRLADQLHLPR